MLLKSVSARVKAMDLYKKIPKNLSEATYTGALISIISICVIVLLSFSELKLYLNYDHYTDI